MFISVIILNWNRKEEALHAIQSVLNRQPDSVEVILWDNGSSDDSKAFLTNTFGEDVRVRLVWHGKNAGVCLGRNLAAELARGDTLVFMDSDSLLETPNGFSLAHKKLWSDPAVAALNFEIRNRHGALLWPFARNKELWQTRSFEITRIDGCGFMIRKDLFQRAGGFPLHFGYGAEEHFLARRCLSIGYNILYFPDVSVTHLHVPSGRTPDQFATMMRNHIWMPLELFRMPWALFSAMAMTISYARDAWSDHRMKDFLRGLWWTIRDFRWSRRQPMPAQAWKHFRSIIREDRRLREYPLPATGSK